ncbi:transcriptional regulator, TetR family [Fulvimarina manganoxydans]|uniref:Transcriptional regulator, TetR family n=1 Tax=Fulvimarina manganoxydans TaxID=937218 RepID=A0A1W2EM58_9HYPH|nr:TetR family transcriptional regulator [Fulvimarina manganoxydans]SMD10754.1 transcriptional regulator, TetR family [Fulvimarina manganoxydans]
MSQDGDPSRRGRRAADAQGGRDALILAATRSFAHHGYEAAGLRAIAAAAKVAPNLVAVHFGNKEGLWHACVEAFAQMLEPKIAALAALSEYEEMRLRGRLELAIGMTAAHYDQNPDLRGFIARGSLEPPPRGDIIAERLLRPLFEAARPLIQQGIDAKLIAITDPAVVFVILNSALSQPDRMASALARLSPDQPTETVSARIGEALTQLLLRPRDAGEREP